MGRGFRSNLEIRERLFSFNPEHGGRNEVAVVDNPYVVVGSRARKAKQGDTYSHELSVVWRRPGWIRRLAASRYSVA